MIFKISYMCLFFLIFWVFIYGYRSMVLFFLLLISFYILGGSKILLYKIMEKLRFYLIIF